MPNGKSYFDHRDDFNGPDKQKRGFPKRPDHVSINKDSSRVANSHQNGS